MVPELEEDFLHLEGGWKRLDENGASDGAVGHADVGLGKVEDVVPETGLLVVLHLGQVKVRAVAAGDELLCVVEEVEREIEDGA